MNNKCKTKYPIVLVHGIGFRDREHLRYWGRIPKALEEEGCEVYYGNQDSWGTIEHNAKIIKQSIEDVLKKTNCKKVNIIAHSKGGLEARYLISNLGMFENISSLTTIGTPHHGSKSMSLLCKAPPFIFKIVAFFINIFFKLLGDVDPNVYLSCMQLTISALERFNIENEDKEGVFYQSYAAVMKNPFSDLFMFFPNLIVSIIEGENDGLVTIDSAKWANFKGILRGVTNRGISHADEVDFRRMNFSKKTDLVGVYDIRDIYIDIVSNLKEMGF